MLIEVDSSKYCEFFPTNPHSFISQPFIELNQAKTNQVIRLVNDGEKVSLGIVAGCKDGIIQSPFSAPFGGFHFRNEIMYISEIDNFLISLKDFLIRKGYIGINITLPPDIYHLTFNAKTINSLIRNGFKSEIPDITGWVDLQRFDGTFTQKNSKEYYRQAIRNGLIFTLTSDETERREIYNVICQNRARFNRPIYMTFDDIINTGKLWPVDFFKVNSIDNKIVASAIFYRNHPEICYAVFWGDNEEGRPLRAMDFLAYNLWEYYKNLGFRYLDFGTSTESGNPNEGLLRFKESHEAISSLRFKFSWRTDMIS